MKTTIEVRYGIGDKVFDAGVNPSVRRVTCPDCLDTRKWKARTPAGELLDFDCPRCQWQHEGQPLIHEWTPIVRLLTIGSIKFDSTSNSTSYMCVETGIGSGRVYAQDDLHETEELALAVAKLKCSALAEKPEHKARYNADYLCSNSTFIAREVSEETTLRRKYQYRVEAIEATVFNQSLSDSEVRDQLKRYLEEK